MAYLFASHHPPALFKTTSAIDCGGDSEQVTWQRLHHVASTCSVSEDAEKAEKYLCYVPIAFKSLLTTWLCTEVNKENLPAGYLL